MEGLLEEFGWVDVVLLAVVEDFEETFGVFKNFGLIEDAIFREVAEEAADLAEADDVSCSTEVGCQKGRGLDYEQMEDGKIDALAEFLVAFDEMAKLVLQQSLKILNLFRMLLKVLVDTVIKKRILSIEDRLTSKQSFKFIN
jgi:hypothetical protein